MSLLKIRRDRTKYTAPVVKLCVSLAIAGGAKFGESLVNVLYDDKYATTARVVFCIVAAICAILCYQALMEMGYVYDNRHPNAAASVGAEKMTVGEVMDVIENAVDVRIALLLGNEGTLIVGVRAKSAAAEDFTRTYFAAAEEFEDADALAAKLDGIAEDGKLTVAAIDEVTASKYKKLMKKQQNKDPKEDK